MTAMDQVEKELVHTRQIICRGYRRKDGLWQIEASVVDEKGEPMPFRARPTINPGEVVHQMALCVVIDDDYQIRDVRAQTLSAPWPDCNGVAEAYRELVGLRVGPGLSREVRNVLGKTRGCAHITDLLVQVGNTYLQASWPDREARQLRASGDPRQWPDPHAASFIGECYNWRPGAEAISREYPLMLKTEEPTKA